MKHLTKIGISAGLAVVAVLTLSALLGSNASAGEDATAGTVPVDTFNVCRPDGDGTYTFFADQTEALDGDLVDGVDGTFKNQNHCDALAPVEEETPPPPPPDSDADGVADDADACPDAGFTTDADGDGCEDPVEQPTQEPPADTGGDGGGDGSGEPPANGPPANDPPANDPPAGDGTDGAVAAASEEGDIGTQAFGPVGAFVCHTEDGGDTFILRAVDPTTHVDAAGVDHDAAGHEDDVFLEGDEDDCPDEAGANEQITICHVHGSATNRYGINTIDADGWDGIGNDHTTHEADGFEDFELIRPLNGGCPEPTTAPALCHPDNGGGTIIPAPGNDPEAFEEWLIHWNHGDPLLSDPESQCAGESSITICKVTIPAGIVEDFDINATGVDDFTLTGDGDCEFINGDLEAGEFSFVEDVPTGFELTDPVTCEGEEESTITPIEDGVTIDLVAGENITCTFENTQIGQSITICKATDPAGLDDSFDFTGDLGGFTLVGDGDCEPFAQLEVGDFAVTETVPEGFTLMLIACEGTEDGNILFSVGGVDPDQDFADGDDTVHIDLTEGANVTCTFTNAAEEVLPSGSIEICKEVVGTTTSQQFNINGDLDIENLGDGECDANSELEAGEFDVFEVVPAGFDLFNVICAAEGESTDTPIANGVTIDLAEGDLVSCTFFNIEEGTPPPPPGDDDDSDVGGVRRPGRVSDVGGVRQPGKPGVGTGDGSFEPFTSFKEPADATSTWLPAIGFLAAMGLAGMAVAHVQRRSGNR